MTILKVLSVGAVKRGVARVAAAFEKDTGAKVNIEFTPVPELRQRVAGSETADVLVATPHAMDEFAAQGRIVADSRGFVGRSRMGLVVRRGGSHPTCPRWRSSRRQWRNADAIQNVTAYDAAVAAASREQDNAAVLAHFLTAPEAKSVLMATGID